MKLLDYPEARQVIVSGDIHGDFKTLAYKLCIQYECKDTLLVVAGDCGFGFDKPGYYDQIYNKVASRLSKSNNWIVFVRGNHDNPEYFSEEKIAHKRWRTIPDYSVITAAGHSILCIGGATSIDRYNRMKHDARNRVAEVASYWPNEGPIYNPSEISDIALPIDTVITHTSPSFCELSSHIGLKSWAEWDPELIEDVARERETMDKIFYGLKEAGHNVERWFYGHFHQSWNAVIDGVQFSMLDIMEFKEVR